jgi:hypothetical protein
MTKPYAIEVRVGTRGTHQAIIDQTGKEVASYSLSARIEIGSTEASRKDKALVPCVHVYDNWTGDWQYSDLLPA